MSDYPGIDKILALFPTEKIPDHPEHRPIPVAWVPTHGDDEDILQLPGGHVCFNYYRSGPPGGCYTLMPEVEDHRDETP